MWGPPAGIAVMLLAAEFILLACCASTGRVMVVITVQCSTQLLCGYHLA
jgi:hypothetical protein